jgi:hypothetical protein
VLGWLGLLEGRKERRIVGSGGCEGYGYRRRSV